MPVGQFCEVVKQSKEPILRLGAVDSKPGFEWPQVAPLITMRASINGMECQRSALIDGGATSNFVARRSVVQCQLKTTSLRQPFKVKFADGRVASCAEIVDKAALKLSTHDTTDCGSHALFVLDTIDKYDLILGRPFLIDSDAVVHHRSGAVVWNKGEKAVVNAQASAAMEEAVATMHLLEGLEGPTRNQMMCLMAIEAATVDAKPTVQQGHEVGSVHQRKRLQQCVEQYRQQMAKSAGLPPKRGEFDHKITLKDPKAEPVKSKAIPLNPVQAKAMKATLDELLATGLIRRSVSPYGLPAFMVGKEQGKKWRMVVDYRKLNELTIKNATSLPHAKELMARLSKARVFTKLDLKSGYNQVRMDEADIEKTAFNTPFGHFEWLVMPFGESNAPATFVQLLTQLVLAELVHDFIIVFVDDILIFSEDEERHLDHIQRVLDKLTEHSLFLNPDKCTFMVDELDFLGFHLKAGNDGVRLMIQRSKVEAVLNWPAPRTQTELRSFLGMANFCRNFVPNFADIARPLTDLTSNKAAKASTLNWSSREQFAFERVKQALCSAPALAVPDEDKQFTLFTDASDFAIGAMLCQRNSRTGELQSCGFMSTKLQGSMLNWSTFDKEFFAIIAALDHWQMHLMPARQRIDLFTDHKALQYVLKSPVLNGRQSRWIAFLSRFRLNVKYLRGESNNVADALSRRPDHESTSEELQQVRRDAADVQLQDLQLNSLILSAIEGAAPSVLGLLHEITSGYNEDENCKVWMKEPNRYRFTVSDGLLINAKDQIIVPDNRTLRTRIIAECHDADVSGHLGVQRTMQRLSKHFQWQMMAADVHDYVVSCSKCQRNKSENRKAAGLLQPIEPPATKGSAISIDFVGPLPTTARKKDAIFVMVDSFTKRVFYEPVRMTITAKQAAKVLFDRVVRHQGLPETIVSDRDPRFTSKFWTALWEQCGSKLAMSTSFHPQTDGQTERNNRTMQEMLRSFVNESMKDWDVKLPALEVAFNSSIHAATGFAPFELDIGVNAKLPLDLAVKATQTSKQRSWEEFLAQWQRNCADAQRTCASSARSTKELCESVTS